MSYYFSKVLKGKGFDEAIELVTAGLKTEGFGILSEIDVSETLKNRIGVDFRKYKILGACNPHFAHKALTAEDKVGVFLPCNVVVQEHENGLVEVTAVDPVASMMSIENPVLTPLAGEVKQKLKRVIDAL
jgi:uncharacterized protein (DUF302 family)